MTLLFALMCPVLFQAQGGDLKQEVERLRQSQKDLQKQVDLLRDCRGEVFHSGGNVRPFQARALRQRVVNDVTMVVEDIHKAEGPDPIRALLALCDTLSARVGGGRSSARNPSALPKKKPRKSRNAP